MATCTNWRRVATSTLKNTFPRKDKGGRAHRSLGLLRLFQSFRPSLRSHNYLLHVAVNLWVLCFFTKFLQEGLNLGKDEKHLPRETAFEKQFPIERPMQDERRGHLPVSAHLTHPGVFLATEGGGDLHDFIGGIGPETQPPVSCFAKFGFAPQVIEL